MISWFRFFCLFAVLLVLISNCNNENSNNNAIRPDPPFLDTTIIKPYKKVDTVSLISICKKEKELIRSITVTMKNRVANAKKAYNALRIDDLKWGKYIRNWNIEAKNFRQAYNNYYFDCIRSFYIGDAWNAFQYIGTCYAADALSDVSKFERKLNSDIAQTLKELKSISSK